MLDLSQTNSLQLTHFTALDPQQQSETAPETFSIHTRLLSAQLITAAPIINPRNILNIHTRLLSAQLITAAPIINPRNILNSHPSFVSPANYCSTNNKP